MTVKTHTIETAGGTVKTRTARRFIVVEFRGAEFYVARETRIYGREVARSTDRAEAAAAAAAHTERTGEETRVETYVRYAHVEKRTDSFATARRVAARSGRSTVIFDAATGETVA